MFWHDSSRPPQCVLPARGVHDSFALDARPMVLEVLGDLGWVLVKNRFQNCMLPMPAWRCMVDIEQ